MIKVSIRLDWKVPIENQVDGHIRLMNIVKHMLGAVIFLSLNILAFGQTDANHLFEHISVEEGLSQSSVYSIYQDSQGFMWFGTEDGLNRYDGYNVQIFNHNAGDLDGLSNNTIYTICEDSNECIWLGTHGGGLNKFDRNTGKFSVYLSDPEDPTTLSSNYVYSIIKDPLLDGVLWIGTTGGLNRYDTASNQFTTNLTEYGIPESMNGQTINILYLDHQNILWIGSGNGLASLDHKTHEFKQYLSDPIDAQSLSGNYIYSIHEDTGRRLWVGTDQGLDAFDGQTGKFKHYPSNPGDSNTIPNDLVNSIYTDYSGNTWFGTASGLSKFEPGDERFTHYFSNPNDPESISADNVLSIFEDRSHVLWIGTSGGGVNKYDLKGHKFSHYQSDPHNPNSLNDNQIMALFKDHAQVLWIGTSKGGLNKFNRASGQFTHYLNDPGDPHSLSDNSVAFIYEDRFQNLWIGTDAGLNKFNKTMEQFTSYRHDPDNPRSLSSDFVSSMVEDSAGVFWIGTLGGGLNRFDSNQEIFLSYQSSPDVHSSLIDNSIYTVIQDRNGFLWIGTDSGLDKFDKKTGSFTHYKSIQDDPNSLNISSVYSIIEDQSGLLWIGTGGGGLNVFDRNKGVFSAFTKKDGLANDVVYGIVESDAGELWLSTNLGLSRFNSETESFTNYTISDGLQSNEFNGGAYCISEDDEIFFGGINGYNSFYPEKIEDNSNLPSIVITDFFLFNELVVPGVDSPLEKPVSMAESVTLDYSNDVISFGFCALEFTAPEKNQYAYMMEGFDSDWIYCGNRRFVTYTNLTPGVYTFKVKGSNNDGVWNNAGTALKLVITPPFWQRAWFRFLGGIFIFSLIAVIYRTRIRSIEKNKKILEKLVLLRTVELKNSERKYRDLFEKSEDAALIIKDGRFIDCNAATLKMLGYRDKNELLNTHPSELSPEKQPDGRPSIEKADEMIELAKRKGSHRFEWNHMKADGEIFPVEVLLTLIPISDQDSIIYTVWRDLTERTQAEAERLALESQRRQMEEKYQILFLKMLDGFALHELIYDAEGNPADYRFITVNPAFERLTGLKAQDIIGKTVLQVIPNTEKYWIDTYGQVVITGEPALIENYAEGLGKYFEVTAFKSAENQFATIFADVTKQKRAEFERVQLEKQLMQSQKLETVGTMVGGVSHELNNVLQSMFLWGGLIQDELPPDSEVYENMQQLLDGGERARDLVNQILTFSRKSDMNYKVQNIQDIVMSALHFKQASLPPNITLDVSIDSQCGTILCDTTEIHQIVINLCNNAEQAIGEQGGEIKVCLQELEGKIGDGSESSSLLELKVSDTGHGMDPKTLERIFDPFFTTKGIGEGTGLGLSVVYGIVRMMKGRISASSIEGEGSTFKIYFPLAESALEKPVDMSQGSSSAVAGCILLVDDEVGILKATQAALHRRGFKVDIASDGAEALEYFITSGKTYDFVVTDLSMPKLSGTELAKKIRESDPLIPIILSTGNIGVSSLEEYRAMGISGFIQKPWTAAELINVVGQLKS